MKVSRWTAIAVAAMVGSVAFLGLQAQQSFAVSALLTRIYLPIVYERASAESVPLTGATPTATTAPGQPTMTPTPTTIPAGPTATATPSSGAPATSVDVTSRASVKAFYGANYARAAVDPNWTGSVASCTPGATSAAFKDEVKTRINFFRLMAGVPAINGLIDAYNTKAQAAALMMSANNNLDHFPPASWTCYSADGADAAKSSNLSLGAFGPDAITGQFQDSGAGNFFVGHRRWILYPRTQNMGTGDIPFNGNNNAANALWVFDANQLSTRPATRDAFVAWPPNGFVPYQVVYQRWSFSYPNADFTGATVTVSSGGQNLTTTIINPASGNANNGYGENTLVWTLPTVGSFQPVSGDVLYDVTVGNVLVNGTPQQFKYTVRIIDPAQ